MAFSKKQKLLFIFFPLLLIGIVVIVVVVVVTEQSAKKGKSQTDETSASPSSMPSSSPSPPLSRFSFDDMFTFSPGLTFVNWISGSSFVKLDGGNITLVDLTTNETKLLVPASVLKSQKAESSLYALSPDKQWVLLTCNKKKLYRHSYTADYVAYNVDTGNITRITPPDETTKIQLAIWGKKGNSLAFVQNNNIYYMANIRSEPRALTSNGEEHKIFNGITDWVYEEDVYYSKRAMWFSPDDTYLGFVEFNDTEVDWFSYVRYGSYSQEYPEVLRIAYPKVGRPNPQVKVHVVDLKNVNATPTVLEPPQEFKNVDHYFTNMAWVNTTQVMIYWSNRVQNVSILTQHDVISGTRFVNQRQDVKNGWVDKSTYLRPNPWLSKDGSYYLTMRAFDQGKNGNFLHMARIDTGQNATIKNLTSGEWEVSDILAFDQDREIAYFSSTETSPRESHIYSFDMKTKTKTCLSCSLAWAKSGRCKYFRASFSKTALWYDLKCYGPGVPMSTRHNTQTNAVLILQSNEQVSKKLKTMMVPQRYNFQYKSGDYMIDAMEIRPPNFDPKKKYGVLFAVYGGPGYQRVTEQFSASNTGWEAYLVSNFDIIVVKIDGRGQKSRGEKFKHAVYLKLGEYEAEDTITAGRYMQSKPYVDKDKLAIWGWSYGGFLTTYVLSKNSGVFKVGIAVAPVTDWRYYDTAYTERYMGLLKDNMAGYNFTSLLRRASKFRNVSYLIVHGSGDDNVHYQHTAQMVKALTLAQIDFRVQYYTDKAHSIAGGLTRRHLWHLLTKFLTSKLGLHRQT